MWPRGVALWLLSWLNAGLLLGLPLGVGGAVHAVFTSTRGFLWGFALGLLLTPAIGVLLRPLVNCTRRLVSRWCGVPVPIPYLPSPRRSARPGKARLRHRLRWLLRDPATWRDLLWVVSSSCVSWTLPLSAGPAGFRLLICTPPRLRPASPIDPSGPAGPAAARPARRTPARLVAASSPPA